MYKNFLIQSLQININYYIECYHNLKTLYNNDSVHDFRVSIRKLMSLLNLIDEINKFAVIQQINETLKIQIKSFNKLRDIQVQLEDIKNKILAMPELSIYNSELFAIEQKFLFKLKNKLNKFEVIEIQNKIIILQKNINGFFNDNYDIYDSVYKVTHNTYQNLINKIELSNESEISTIHKVRLSLKNFRYIIEIIQGYTRLSKIDIKKLRYFQNLLGDIQDNCVFESSLKKFILKMKLNENNYEKVFEYIYNVQNRLIKEYIENKNVLIDFWQNELFVM